MEDPPFIPLYQISPNKPTIKYKILTKNIRIPQGIADHLCYIKLRNSGGLHDEEHYTTAYDMYLLFNKAISFGKFIEIISMSEYSTIYHDSTGGDIPFECEATNRYLKGQYHPPQAVEVIGGKTGTTAAAGACLVLLSKDPSDNSYISVVMKADNVDVLYKKTNNLLELLQ